MASGQSCTGLTPALQCTMCALHRHLCRALPATQQRPCRGGLALARNKDGITPLHLAANGGHAVLYHAMAILHCQQGGSWEGALRATGRPLATMAQVCLVTASWLPAELSAACLICWPIFLSCPALLCCLLPACM